MKNLNLNRIFYIYTESHLAVLMLVGFVVELFAGLCLIYSNSIVQPVGYFALASSPFFLTVALGLIYSIYKQEKRGSYVA